MKRIREKRRTKDRGIAPLVAGIIVVGIIATGYFTTEAIKEMNRPAVEAVKSTSPLNAGIGSLFLTISHYWLETLFVLALIVLSSVYIKSRRRKK